MKRNSNISKTRRWAEKFTKNATKYTWKLKQIPKIFDWANVKKDLAEMNSIQKR